MASTTELDVKLRAYVPVWERFGAPLPATITATNIADARRATGLDWEPTAEPVYRALDGSDVHYEPKDNKNRAKYKFITRGLHGPDLDVANGTYRIFTNAEMFAVAEAIGIAGLERGQDVRFVSGGELSGGRKVYLMADLGTVHIPGDPSPHVRYVGFINGHDGSASVKVIGTSTRWFCTNQFRAAEIDGRSAGTAFSFRHTARVGDRVEKAKKALIAALFQHKVVEDATAELLCIRISAPQRDAFVDRFTLSRIEAKATSSDPERAALSKLRQQALDNSRDILHAILASRTCEGIAETAYGPLAAAVEFLDHHRGEKTTDGTFSRQAINTDRDKILAVRTMRALIN